MKKLFVLCIFLLFGKELFAQNLSALERQIILAAPEEMLRMVLDPGMEAGLCALFEKIEELEADEIFPAYMAAFPGITEDECAFIILKVALIAALGSGNEYGVDIGLDILDYCEEVDSMADLAHLPEDIQELMKSPYWQDCIAFYRIFDYEVFFTERYPEYF
jgi:hypothetical protein